MKVIDDDDDFFSSTLIDEIALMLPCCQKLLPWISVTGHRHSGFGGAKPPIPVPCPPGGGLGGFAPQESPLITRALPPQRPCLAPVPCPPFFSSEFVRPNFFARMARILMIFGPFESHRRQRKFEKISNERKIIESIESIDSIERSRDRSDRSTAAVVTRNRSFPFLSNAPQPQAHPHGGLRSIRSIARSLDRVDRFDRFDNFSFVQNFWKF